MIQVWGIECGVMGLGIFFALCYYSARPYSLCSLICVFLSFQISLSPLLLLPHDLGQQNSIETSSFLTLWRILYFTNFAFSWFLLPFAQQFQQSGEFSFRLRIRDSLRANAIGLGIMLIAATIFVVYLLIFTEFSFIQLPEVFAVLSNCFGLFLLCLFLGHGLVALPKQCFLRRDYRRRVARCHSEAERLSSDQATILEEVHSIRQQLLTEQRVESQRQIVLTQINTAFDAEAVARAAGGEVQSKRSTSVLRREVQRRALQYRAQQFQFDDLVDQLQSVSESFMENNYRFKRLGYTLLFGISTVTAAVIFIGEISGVLPWLQTINLFRLLNSEGTWAVIINSVTLLLIGFMLTYAVFQVKVYRRYGLHRGNSSAGSLIFTALNLTRLVYPLCLNYLQLIAAEDCTLLEITGPLTLRAPFIFPLFMIAAAVANALDLYSIILGYLGLSSYAFDSDQLAELREHGREILMRRLAVRNINTHRLEMIQLL